MVVAPRVLYPSQSSCSRRDISLEPAFEFSNYYRIIYLWMFHKVFQEITRSVLPELTDESKQILCGILFRLLCFSSLVIHSLPRIGHHSFLACCVPPLRELPGGMCWGYWPWCFWWMELKVLKFLAFFVIIVMTSIADMRCPGVLYQRKLRALHSYSYCLPPMAQPWVQPGVSRTGEGAAPEEKSFEEHDVLFIFFSSLLLKLNSLSGALCQPLSLFRNSIVPHL